MSNADNSFFSINSNAITFKKLHNYVYLNAEHMIYASKKILLARKARRSRGYDDVICRKFIFWQQWIFSNF